MSNDGRPSTTSVTFGVDSTTLTRSDITGVRIGFGIMGGVAFALGLVLLFWPTKSPALIGTSLGIYFAVTGIVRFYLGIVRRGLDRWERSFDIFLGAVLVILAIVIFRFVSAAPVELLFIVVTVIGIGWIVEGIFAIIESGSAVSRAWAITFGIVSIVGGGIILASPVWTVANIVIFGSIVLLVLGTVGIVRAVTFGRDDGYGRSSR